MAVRQMRKKDREVKDIAMINQIIEEMDAIRGKGNPGGGRVSLSRFMDGLVAYCRNASE